MRKHNREKGSSDNKTEDDQGSRPRGSLQSKSSKNTNSFDRANVVHKSGRDKDKHSSHQRTSSLHKEKERSDVTYGDRAPGEHKVADKLKHSTENRQHRNKHRSALDNSLKKSLEKNKDERCDSVGKLKHVEKAKPETIFEDKNNSKRRDRSRSKDNHETKPEIIADRHHKTKKATLSESDASLKTDKNKRREYVINYDDKNGTVSSVCQLKPGTSKRKTLHPEKSKEIKMKTKSSDKSSLRK